MKHRLAMALRHVSLMIDPDTKHLREVPDKFYDLAKRISYRDYCTTYIALIRNPDISAEWVIRGTGNMLVSDDLRIAELEDLKSRLIDLRNQLSREVGRNNMLINKLAELTKEKDKKRRGGPLSESQD